MMTRNHSIGRIHLKGNSIFTTCGTLSPCLGREYYILYYVYTSEFDVHHYHEYCGCDVLKKMLLHAVIGGKAGPRRGSRYTTTICHDTIPMRRISIAC